MNDGKRKCEILKEIRRQVAEQYDLRYKSRECHNDGDCQGTCPLCDAELKSLQEQLKAKGIDEVSFNETLNKRVEEFLANSNEIDDGNDVIVLEGDIEPPTD